MFDHQSYRQRFIDRSNDATTDEILGAAKEYGADLETAAIAPDQDYWRVVGVHHLTPDENRGRNQVFVDAVDEEGRRVRDPRLRMVWGWKGQRPDEQAQPRALDKADFEPAGSLDVYPGQHTWLRIEGDGLASDRVHNLHTDHADEPASSGSGNTRGRHSYYVLFQRARKRAGEDNGGGDLDGEPTLPPEPEPELPMPPEPEPEPKPEPEPEPVQPPGAAIGNRLGFYLHMSTDQHGLWNAISRIQPPVIFVHADTANRMLLNEIRAFRSPNAFVIGRMYKDNHTQRTMLESSDPEGQGRAFAEEILAHDFGLATARGANGRLLIDAWISLNEPVPGPASQQFAQRPEETSHLLDNYDRFQVAFRRKLMEAGVEAVAFNFGAGNFGEPAHYLDHCARTLAEYVYLGFHEYGWPTLFPADGSATSGGSYRRCMEGIRTRYGARHRAVMTEAGLTRMYQNPAWGDVGWLNTEQTLSEDDYWASLAWYNDLMLGDAYVLGACLYEVGHHGDWVSFRHLGQDNRGNDLHLVDRMAALNPPTVAAPAPAQTPQPAAEPRTLEIGGVVTLQGRPVAEAVVRLIGGADTVGQARGAALNTASYVSWSRPITGFAGGLWHLWSKEVSDSVAGITWDEFKQRFEAYNPVAAADGLPLRAERTYFVPENKDVRVEILWDRPLTGFSGTLWALWRMAVANRVVGLDYAAFKQGMRRHNPHLADSHNRLQAHQRFMLPRNAGHTEYLVQSQTSKTGRYHFSHLPPGGYRIEVEAPGAQPFSAEFSCVGDITVNAPLLPRSHFETLEMLTPAAAPQPSATPRVESHPWVGVNGDEFVVAGRAFRFVGVNVRGLVHYGDGRNLQYAQEGHRAEQLQGAYDIGARVVRVFLPSIHVNAAETIARLRAVVELVRQRFPGLYLLPAFANLYGDVPFRIPGDERFYARIDPNFNGDLLVADFFKGGYNQNFLPFVRQVVPAFKDEPVLFAWEIGNELKLDPAHAPQPGDPHLAAFLDFMRNAAREVRTLDPNHLITTGMISTRHASLQDDTLKRQLYASPLFNFITVHCYNHEYENDDSRLAETLHKPYIIEEAGFGRGFGNDRSQVTRDDMDRWFARKARGYMPWGFMATPFDIGDGDSDSGLDRTLHSDWGPMTDLLRGRATEFSQLNIPLQPAPLQPVSPPQPPPDAGFATGQQVYAQTWLNVRRSPGHVGKPGDDVIATLEPGAAATVTGGAMPLDGLVWWPLRTALSDGRTIDVWGAETLPGVRLLDVTPPPAPAAAPATVSIAGQPGRFALGETVFAQSYVNLRRDPGHIDKPADHILGQVALGAPLTVLDGPRTVDGLTWWRVRGPLLDNSVADGWAAEADGAGFVLLDERSPAAPPPFTDGVWGQPITPGETAIIVARWVNLRRTPGYIGQPAEHVIGMLTQGLRLTVVEGPRFADELEWWRLRGLDGQGSLLDGWMALTGPDGTRLFAREVTAQLLRVAHPFAQPWPVTQGWGGWSEYYSAIPYDGVPLRGHNGLDFGTPPGIPLLAADDGEVVKVAYEPDGFGHHLLLRHAWGETLYAHLDRIDAGMGRLLAQSEQLGLSGASGRVFGAHLHFGLRIYPYRRTDGWGGFVNPAPWMQPADLVTLRSPNPAPPPMAPEWPGRRRP